MRTIRLTRSNTGWNAEYLVNNKPDTSIVELFGTHNLPTAFTSSASAHEVVDEIQKENPDCNVYSIESVGF